MTLKTAISVEAGIVIVQEPFIGSQEICHNGFNFYWPPGKRKEIRVMTAVRKDLGDKIMTDHRTDLIYHPYFMLLEIRELDSQSKKPRRKTQVVNVYNNRVGRGYTRDDGIRRIRRALEDVNWEPIMWSRVLIAGDINAYSSIWNPHCHRRQNASVLEEFIGKFSLLINNKLGRPTRPASQGISVIDLSLSIAELGPLTLWEIPEKHPALLDHLFILLRWEDADIELSQPKISKATG